MNTEKINKKVSPNVVRTHNGKWYYYKFIGTDPNIKITGKYLFFSEYWDELEKIVIEEIENNGFSHGKIISKEHKVGKDYVLCLYYKNDGRGQELAQKYMDNTNIRYRYWKRDEDTLNGVYSKKYLNEKYLNKLPSSIGEKKMKKIEELMKVPLVGYKRAKAMLELGINNIKELSESEIQPDTSIYPCFLGKVFELIKNYAKAIMLDKPLIIGRHPFFKEKKNIYFFDAEYDPVGTTKGPYGIFLLGIMDTNGKTKQLFLDDPTKERSMLDEFNNWLKKEKPILIAYSSTSADKPQLINAFNRFEISTTELKNTFFDLYYDCISTQKLATQFIYLPMTDSKGVKDISDLLGYNEPKDLEIKDGFEALMMYNHFFKKKNDKIKNDLLYYNKIDLERTKFIFDHLKKLQR